jgi:hypothetical protein
MSSFLEILFIYLRTVFWGSTQQVVVRNYHYALHNNLKSTVYLFISNMYPEFWHYVQSLEVPVWCSVYICSYACSGCVFEFLPTQYNFFVMADCFLIKIREAGD